MENLRKVIVCQVNIQENVSRFISSTNVDGRGRYEHDHDNKVKGYHEYHTDNKHEQLQKSFAGVCSSVSANMGKMNKGNCGYPGDTRSVQVLRPCIFCRVITIMMNVINTLQ